MERNRPALLLLTDWCIMSAEALHAVLLHTFSADDVQRKVKRDASFWRADVLNRAHSTLAVA